MRSTTAPCRQRSALKFLGFAGAFALLAMTSYVATGQMGRAGAATPAESGYSIGYDLGRDIADQLASDRVSTDLDALIKGFSDGLKGAKPSIDPAKMEIVLTALHHEVAERSARDRLASDPVFAALARHNEQVGTSFRQSFAKRDGAKTLPSGVIFSVVRTGDGPEATNARTVVVNFVSMLPSGHEVARGRGTEFRLDTMLPGVQEFVRKMRVGERVYVAVPPDRAYGLAGREPDVGPNETVVVDLELVSVKD